MTIFRSLVQAPVQLSAQGSIVVIGTFDGMHLGHQALIAKAKYLSSSSHMPVCVVTFEPSPRAFFNKKFGGSEQYAKIQRFYDKAEYLKTLGVDYVFCLSFNQRLSDVTALNFLDLLTNHLGAKQFCVGDDFQFGKNKEGNTTFLQDYAMSHNQSLYVMPSIIDTYFNKRISSTIIRELLQEGNLPQVARLLGRNYSISGKVGFGAKIGREIGFQTANISLRHYPTPLRGIFAVKVVGIDNESTQFLGVASIGTNPTVSDNQQ